MSRRSFLQSLAVGGSVLAAGCVESLPLATTRLESDEVFADTRFEDSALVVQFRDDVDVERVTLSDSAADEEYDTAEYPGDTVRFPVVFPDRLESSVSHSLRVTAETADGEARAGVGKPVHAYVHTVEPLPDGRARLEIESQTSAPALVRFLAISGDVPNPTVDPQRQSVDRESLPFDPGVVGVGENRPIGPSRTDLVVPPEETRTFETTYAPFAFPGDSAVDSTAESGANAAAADCDGGERRGTVTVVHGSGGSAAYDFTYRLDGEPTTPEDGLEVAVCSDVTSASR